MSFTDTQTEETQDIAKYDVVLNAEQGAYYITRNGEVVTNGTGDTRYFSTPSSARKAITRLRRPEGDRHR